MGLVNRVAKLVRGSHAETVQVEVVKNWNDNLSIFPMAEAQPPLQNPSSYRDLPGMDSGLTALRNRADFETLLANDAYPLPAIEDREGYYGERHFEYWLSGLRDYLFVQKTAQELGVALKTGSSILDVGCASGRVLRHFLAHDPAVTVYGAEVNRNHVTWLRQHLSTTLQAFQNTFLPNLPLEDRSIDVVYAYSVFSHIDEYEEAWLMELRRLLKVGGIAVFSIHSDRTWLSMKQGMPIYHALLSLKESFPELDMPAMFAKPMPQERMSFRHQTANGYGCNMFYTKAYIAREWGRFFEIVDIVPEAHGYQDCVVLRKK